MSMEEEIQKIFGDKFVINNASSRSKDEMIKIIEMCNKCDKFLVYLIRNNKNSDFFDHCSELANFMTGKVEKPKVIFFQGAGYYSYPENIITDYKAALLNLRRRLCDDRYDCVVCERNDFNDYFSCGTCGNIVCRDCMKKIQSCVCPICRGERFIQMMKD